LRAKKALAETAESKASAQGEHKAATKDLAEEEKELQELHHDCLDRATSFEDAVSTRKEELKALSEAKKVIVEATGGAVKQTYGSMVQSSFLQVRSRTSSKSSSSEESNALHVVRRLALDTHSEGLLGLSQKMSKLIRTGTETGVSPFGKLRGMIASMLSALESEAASEATKKAYCDNELGETSENAGNKEDEVEKLSTKIDVMTASTKKLKMEVAELQKELADLARTKAHMDKLRADEKAAYVVNKPEMEQGLESVKTALKVLREYYGTGVSTGAADVIIGTLEVVESDFSKGIAAMNAEEEAAQTEYETVTKENAVSQVGKEQDVKYKVAEHKSLDKSIAEFNADKDGVNEELGAVKQYQARLEKECIAMPVAFEERKQRREKQIAGLREALEALGGQSMLELNAGSKSLRGSSPADN